MLLPIHKWTCPNHEYPVSIDGTDPWEEFPAVAELLERHPGSPAWVEFGMCCRDAVWEVVGRRDASVFEEMLVSQRSATQQMFNRGFALLSEFRSREF